MLSSVDIQRLCQRKFPAFLKALVTGEQFFPLDVRFGRPSTTDEFEKLRAEIASLTTDAHGYRIEWSEKNTRKWGRQKLPERVWFETEEEFVRAMGKVSDVARFRENLLLTRKICPSLELWLPDNVTALIDFADEWNGLLQVCAYFLKNPRPGLYARELPVDVDTKFIERHHAILGKMLGFLLYIEARYGIRFEERFGILYDEPLIRIRILDESLHEKLRQPLSDFSTPLSRCSKLNWQDLAVIITENKMNFLTLPTIGGAIGIWGGGHAAELLKQIPWLKNCRLFYWGDLDEHGVQILANLRASFPSVTSVMMDAATLSDFGNLAAVGTAADAFDVSLLNAEEREAFDRIRTGNLRLEQEKIPHASAVSRLLMKIRG
jgi:hypothetical protein